MSKDGKRELWREARIVINGATLTFAQSMTFRVALEAYAMQLHADGLGDDAHGRAVTAGYLAHIDAMRRLVHNNLDGISEPQ